MKTNPLISYTLAVFLASKAIAVADGCRPQKENYYSDRERGWFWSEADCVKKDENVTKKAQIDPQKSKWKIIPKKVDIPWAIINQIDPDQIAQLERDAQKISVMYPTDFNIKEHRMLQKWIVDKSVSYTKTGDRINRTDTDLARWGAEVPVSTFARSTNKRQQIKDTDSIIASYANRAGLVVVTQQGCQYCQAQMPILQLLKDQTGMTFKEVDMNRLPAIVSKLGVAQTPDIFLVLNKNGKAQWQRIGSGLNTLVELKEGIAFGLYTLGEIKDERLVYQ